MRIYLKPGQKAPKGANVQTGPHGGRYYEEQNSNQGEPSDGKQPSSSPQDNPEHGRGVDWKPSMSLSEATEFSKDSSVKQTLYHGTRLEGEDKIPREGFNTDFIYLTSYPQYAARYASNGKPLQAKINVKNVKFSDMKEMGEVAQKIMSEGNFHHVYDAASEYFKRQGYDAFVFSRAQSLAGAKPDTIVVFDRKKVVIINEEVKKDAGPITSGTAGVSNPVYSRRKNEMMSFVFSKSSEILKSEPKGMRIDAEFVARELWKAVYDSPFEGMSKNASDEVKSYLIRGMGKRLSLETLKQGVKRIGDCDDLQAEMISRTETSSIRNKLRELVYLKADPDDELKYKWINVNDDRTSDICKKVVSKTSSGVSMAKLKEILHDELRKAGFEADGLRSHPNCRSTFIRVFT